MFVYKQRGSRNSWVMRTFRTLTRGASVSLFQIVSSFFFSRAFAQEGRTGVCCVCAVSGLVMAHDDSFFARSCK